MTTTVRVDTQVRDRINALAASAGVTNSELMERALAAYEDRLFWAEFQTAAADLRADPDAWQAEQDERRLWDRTASDGLA